MSKRKELYNYLKHPGHYFHRVKGRRTLPPLVPHDGSAEEHPESWAVLQRSCQIAMNHLYIDSKLEMAQGLECNILCQIAHSGVIDYSNMRLTCKAWRRELDLCTFIVEPATADMAKIVELFPNANRVDFSACNLTVTDQSLELLPKLKKLTVLDLRGCAAISAGGIGHLADCESLEEIHLGRDTQLVPVDCATPFDSKITDDMLDALMHVLTLRSIHIGYSCKCTVSGVLGLAQLSRLETLHVMGHSTTDFGRLSGENLQRLSRLYSLSIGVVPAEAFQALPHLSRLTSLDLHGDTWEKTLLTLSDIACLQHLTNLQHLGLHHYELGCNLEDLTGDDPSGLHFLYSLVKLDSFSFDNCDMVLGCELLLLHTCRRLKKLHINLPQTDAEEERETELSEELVHCIMHAIESTPTQEWAVEDLEMKGNAAIPKFAAAALTRAPHLRSLRWDCCRSVGEESTVWHDLGLSRWSCAANLSVLDLGQKVRLDPGQVDHLAGYRHLVDMTCSMDNALPQSVSSLTNLTSLNIHWMFAADDGMQLLGSLPGLASLSVSCKDPISDKGMLHLKQLTALTELTVRSDQAEPKVTKAGLKALESLQDLMKLELVSTTSFKAEDLSPISHLRHLRHLEFGNVMFITKAVLQVLEPLAQLRRLWIRIPKEQMWQARTDSIQISKEDLAHLASMHPALSWVCFGNQQMVSLPRATLDRRLLEELVEAERSGSLESLDDPFWLNSDDT